MKFTFEISRSPNTKQLLKRIDQIVEQYFDDLGVIKSEVVVPESTKTELDIESDSIIGTPLSFEPTVIEPTVRRIKVKDGNEQEDLRAKRRVAGLKGAATRKAKQAEARAIAIREARRAKRAASKKKH